MLSRFPPVLRLPRSATAPACIAASALAAGCATAPAPATGDAAAAAAERSIAGTIISINTQPWAYDGHAEVRVDTSTNGQVVVQLPARWNLCKAPAVDVDALAVGMQVQAVGAPGGDGTLVVCAEPTHRLAPLEGGR